MACNPSRKTGFETGIFFCLREKSNKDNIHLFLWMSGTTFTAVHSSLFSSWTDLLVINNTGFSF